MHEHGPDELQGPVRGTSAWWRGIGPPADSPDESSLIPSDTLKSPRKTRKDARPIRQELVDRIRQEIKAGTYDTEEKWEAALERLLEKLDHDD